MKYSIVIPSYDRKEVLEKCIKSIEAAYEFALNQKAEVEIEILAVLCGIKVDLSESNLRFPQLTHIIFLKQNAVSLAKNIGIKKATGAFIVLIDDDAMLKRDFFVTVSKAIDSSVKVYCAKIMDPLTNQCFTEKENTLSRKYLRRVDYNLFRGSALIVRKDILNSAGLFDEQFGPGGVFFSAEESDLFFRIKMLNEPVLFVPETIVYHPTGAILSGEKVLKYSYATGALLTKYCICDLRYAPIYLFLIGRIFLLCFCRIIQMIAFPKTMSRKNQQHRYVSVIKGLTKGIHGYIMKEFGF